MEQLKTKEQEMGKTDAIRALAAAYPDLNRTKLAAAIGKSQPYISRALSVLADAGMTGTRRNHLWPTAGVEKKQANEQPRAEKTPLSQVSSRELIRELYSRGYRIDGGSLFVVEKRKVLLADIINEGEK